ncbi:MAG: hypothetical protein RJB34_514 [Pseudomonadota bacterium]|jgi:hypothetical protein
MKLFAQSGVALAAALIASSALADVSFDANIETNTTKVSKKKLDSGGRVEINANAALVKNGDNYVNAKGTLEVPLTGDKMGIADAWIQLGNKTLDLKYGRFEATDLFPLGKDTVLQTASTAISGYRANTLRGRFTSGQAHAAVGVNAAEGLRFELGIVTEQDASTSPATNSGVRPVVTYSAGALTLRLGMESITSSAAGAKRQTGSAISVGYAINSSTSLNVNVANNSDTDASSTGLNMTAGDFGAGYVQDKNGKAKQNTLYAAYSFPLLGIKGANITPAISHSKADGVKNVNAVRVRMNYAF